MTCCISARCLRRRNRLLLLVSSFQRQLLLHPMLLSANAERGGMASANPEAKSSGQGAEGGV